jgi:UDP:flavonoid glycosyltransferase YjiC (YdhE family)
MRFHWYDFKSSTVLAPEINSFRKNLGLERVRLRGLWSSSPQRVIGLWPDWFYGPQPDWPAQAVVTGFIEYDGAPTEFTLEAWDRVIGNDSAGRAPIVFMAASACFDTADFFAAACEACEILNWPGILLTQQEQPVHRPLPRLVRHIRFAPLGQLLPRTAAIVHHGGIGTAARALKAGIPQLVMPMAYDQHDNANRLVRLGVAKSIARRDFTAERVAACLRDLLQLHTILERCRHYAKKFDCSNALESTCDYIEALSENRG